MTIRIAERIVLVLKGIIGAHFTFPAIMAGYNKMAQTLPLKEGQRDASITKVTVGKTWAPAMPPVAKKT